MNSSYKDLKDIYMSYRLWNGTYYNIILKNIEDIKKKKEECIKKSKKYEFLFDIFLISFYILFVYIVYFIIHNLFLGNKLEDNIAFNFSISISVIFFFLTLFMILSNNLKEKYNDILHTVEEFNIFVKNINYEKDLLITNKFNILGFNKYDNTFMQTDIFYDDVKYVYEKDIKLLGTLNKETDKYEVVLYLPMKYKEK